MVDSNLFTVELVTPERVLLDGQASEVILRTGEGDITFLAGHAPLIGTVEPGVLRVVRPEGNEERVAVHGGFVQVGRDEPDTTRVTLLIGVAEPAEEIDVPRARAAHEAAEARVAELSGSAGRSGTPGDEEDDPELAEAIAARRRAEIRLETAETGAPGAGGGTPA